MLNVPFKKALLYIAIAKCRIDFDQPSLFEFMRYLNELFPFTCFDSPYSLVKIEFDKLHNIPSSVAVGKYGNKSFCKFLVSSDLTNLHEVFDTPLFQDLLYDVDLRKKVEGMSIAGFRYHEIEMEIKSVLPEIDPVAIKAYINCFSNFSDMSFDEKHQYIAHSIEDSSERKLMMKCLENKSRDAVRMFLGITSKVYTPIEIVNRAAQIIDCKTKESLIDGEDDKLNSCIKMSIRIADALHKFGSGNKNAVEDLLSALVKPKEEVTHMPKPMSIDELESMFSSRAKEKEDDK